MNDQHNLVKDELHHVVSFGARHRFIVLITGVIITALVLVTVALTLYRTSGTALLDLSLPGLQAARKQVKEPQSTMEYPATGPINSDTLSEFRRLYDAQTKQVTGVDVYGGDAISDSALSIDDPASLPAQSTN